MSRKRNPSFKESTMPPISPAIRSVVHLATAIVLAVGLGACQTAGTAFSAPPIAPENRIPLKPDGPHQGDADTGELVVAYAYRLGPDSSGEIEVKGGIRTAKYRGDAVNIYLNFLDNAGNVLDKKILYASGYRRDVYVRRPSTFDTTLPLPPGTAAIAFSSFVKPSAGRR
jgi:hypothetical protein